MDFLMNKIGWQPRDVVQAPNAIFFNLEKRIFPRIWFNKNRVVNGLPGLNLKEVVDWSKSFIANYQSANETSNGDTGSCLEWSLAGLRQY
ncbi:hypothetical protein Q3G72_017787 [Acer saccharum]|nr:hypothetical protein Q3G72_017787 [Acer saccharum]